MTYNKTSFILVNKSLGSKTCVLSEWCMALHQTILNVISSVACLHEHISQRNPIFYYLSIKDVVIHFSHAVCIPIRRPAHHLDQSFAYSIPYVNAWPFIMLDNFMDEFFFHCNINQEQIKYEKRENQNAVNKGCSSAELFWIDIIHK